VLDTPDALRETVAAVACKHQGHPPCLMILVAVGPKAEDPAEVMAASALCAEFCGPVLDLRVQARPRA